MQKDFINKVFYKNAQKNIDRLNIYSGQRFEDLPVEGREKYLEYHRNKIFLHT